MLMAVGVALESSMVSRNMASGAANSRRRSAATTSAVSSAGCTMRRVISTPRVTRSGRREAPGPLQADGQEGLVRNGGGIASGVDAPLAL